MRLRCHRIHVREAVLALAAMTAAVFAGDAGAQARQTAARSAGIDIFAAGTRTNNDFYGTAYNNGATVGIDYTQFKYIPRYHALLTPSLELRVSFAPGTPVAERSLEGGGKLAVNYRRLHPYGDFLVGGGTILFNPPAPLTAGFAYASDSSFIYVYGGGIAIDVLPRWALLADYQHQSWDLGFTPDVSFHPQAYSVGVVYHLRLKGIR